MSPSVDEAPAATSQPIRLASDPLVMGVVFALSLTVIQRAIGFVRGMMFCRMMPDDHLGQWSVVWSSLMLLAPLAALGLPGSFCRYAEHYLQRGQLVPYVRRVATLAGLTTALMAFAMMACPGQCSRLIFRESQHAGLIRAMACVLVVVALFNGVQSLMESLRQVRVVTMMRFWSGLAFAFAAIGLLLVWQDGVLAVLVGYGISCLIGLLPALWFASGNRQLIQTSNRPLGHSPMWAKVVPFAAWIWIANFLNNACDSIDRFLLLHLTPADSALAQSQLGQYHSSLIIPQLLVGLAVVISGTILPYLSAAWERKDFGDARRILTWTLKSAALGFFTLDLIVLLAAPLLFRFALQGKYTEGLSILPLSMIYSFWFCLITCSQAALWCNERMRWVATALVIGLLANVALNWMCIPWWGLPGAAFATALSNAIGLAAMLSIVKRDGWTIDTGTWLACGLPVIIVLPTAAAIAAWVLIFFGVWRSDWVFDAAEKKQIRGRLEQLLNVGRKRLPNFGW